MEAGAEHVRVGQPGGAYASWWTKLEHDFVALRASDDALHSRVESLKHDKLALAAQALEFSPRQPDGCAEKKKGRLKKNIVQSLVSHWIKV
ncbi:hypothetical protein ZWY2020_008536 [Hordeum vulgare]|nr:hypothetical protein ZWY2020_008536 [Hordeum vulgare]